MTTASAVLPRRRRRFRAPRQLRIMRAGWFYLALTVAMGFAAENTGNNLVYLTCGLMLGVIVASGLLSERTLRGLAVERQLPSRAVAGRPTLVGLAVRNDKRAASFGVLVEDEATAGRCQLPLVGACEREARSYSFVPAKRGRLRLSTVRVATRFPFGLFEKSLELERPAEIVVRPEPLAAELPLPGDLAALGESPANAAGDGQDPWQLRLHREGEDARAIAWTASARAGMLISLDREQAERRRFGLTLPAGVPRAAFELAVRQAAYVAEVLSSRGIGLSLSLGERELVPPGDGPAHLERLLDALAECEP
ncbi:MAG TPA: DUF58 domain-containing protein [Myxococcales bacterium]|nr:DUF58 domain-containing protein [Myxococcales bacterium]